MPYIIDIQHLFAILLPVVKKKRSSMKDLFRNFEYFCTPSGARTLDPNIKSVVLYQLS